MRVRRAKTSCVTSLMILALSLGDSVVNHFARRCANGVSAYMDSSLVDDTRLCPASTAESGN